MSPESFDVPEPWETAKYRLYPKLYPDPMGKKRRGCGLFFVLLFIVICGLVVITALSKPSAPTAPQPAASSSPKLVSPVPSQEAATVPTEEPKNDWKYHGTHETAFGKDWVVFEGKRIDGITIVNPAPGGPGGDHLCGRREEHSSEYLTSRISR